MENNAGIPKQESSCHDTGNDQVCWLDVCPAPSRLGCFRLDRYTASRIVRVLYTAILLLAAQFVSGYGSPAELADRLADQQIAQERALSKQGAGKDARHLLDQLVPTLRSGGRLARLSLALTDLSILLAADGEYAGAAAAAREAQKASHAIGDQESEARAVDNGDKLTVTVSFAAPCQGFTILLQVP